MHDAARRPGGRHEHRHLGAARAAARRPAVPRRVPRPRHGGPSGGWRTDDRRSSIVGAGLAGAKAAETLRDEGFDGAVVLVGDEPHRPYERPPLSKGYLLGKAPRDKVFVHPEGWYADHDVDLRLGAERDRRSTAGRAGR